MPASINGLSNGLPPFPCNQVSTGPNDTDRQVYEGEFFLGKRQGFGFLQFSSSKQGWSEGWRGAGAGAGSMWYQGDFGDDKPEGKGKFMWPNGGWYEGGFSNGVRTGQGVREWAEGGRFEGNFLNGVPDGHGCLRLGGAAGRDVYEGEFMAGVRHGQGRVTLDGGGVINGQFRWGKLWGEASFTAPNGDVYTQQWDEGLPCMLDGPLGLRGEDMGGTAWRSGAGHHSDGEHSIQERNQQRAQGQAAAGGGHPASSGAEAGRDGEGEVHQTLDAMRQRIPKVATTLKEITRVPVMDESERVARRIGAPTGRVMRQYLRDLRVWCVS